jgi:hypothetical protein
MSFYDLLLSLSIVWASDLGASYCTVRIHLYAPLLDKTEESGESCKSSYTVRTTVLFVCLSLAE